MFLFPYMHKPGAVLLEKRLKLLAYNNIFYWFLRVSPMIPQALLSGPVENRAHTENRGQTTGTRSDPGLA
jgi:hypothetical protein